MRPIECVSLEPPQILPQGIEALLFRKRTEPRFNEIFLSFFQHNAGTLMNQVAHILEIGPRDAHLWPRPLRTWNCLE